MKKILITGANGMLGEKICSNIFSSSIDKRAFGLYNSKHRTDVHEQTFLHEGIRDN